MSKRYRYRSVSLSPVSRRFALDETMSFAPPTEEGNMQSLLPSLHNLSLRSSETGVNPGKRPLEDAGPSGGASGSDVSEPSEASSDLDDFPDAPEASGLSSSSGLPGASSSTENPGSPSCQPRLSDTCESLTKDLRASDEVDEKNYMIQVDEKFLKRLIKRAEKIGAMPCTKGSCRQVKLFQFFSDDGLDKHICMDCASRPGKAHTAQ